jgi:hypothetical protein
VESTGNIHDVLEGLEFMTALEEELQAFILDIDQALLVKVRERRKKEGFHAVTAPGLKPLIGDHEATLAEDDIPAPTIESKGVDKGAVAVEQKGASALGRKQPSGNLAQA